MRLTVGVMMLMVHMRLQSLVVHCSVVGARRKLSGFCQDVCHFFYSVSRTVLNDDGRREGGRGRGDCYSSDGFVCWCSS